MIKTLDKIKAAFGDISAKDRTLGSDIAELEKQRDEIRDAPLSRESYILAGHQSIDALAADYLQRLQHQVNGDMGRAPMGFQHVNDKWFSGLSPNGGPATVPHPNALAYLCGPMIKERFAEAVHALSSWPEKCGLPLAERVEQIAALDRQIAGLQAERKELRSAAKDAGLQILETD